MGVVTFGHSGKLQWNLNDHKADIVMAINDIPLQGGYTHPSGGLLVFSCAGTQLHTVDESSLTFERHIKVRYVL